MKGTWQLNNDRVDDIAMLCSVEGILEVQGHWHIFPHMGRFFSEKVSGFTESMRYKTLTKAQRLRLNPILNCRFTRW